MRRLLLVTVIFLATALPVQAGSNSPREYLALGDSLAVGVGAANPVKGGYVPLLFNQGAFRPRPPNALANFAVSGETSASFITGGQLNRAVQEINRLKNDGDPESKVSLITLDIGGNDLLHLLGEGPCRERLGSPECLAEMARVLVAFRGNLSVILATLKSAKEADAELVVITYYNPLSLGTGADLERFFDEAVRLLNGMVKAEAQARGLPVVDIYPYFVGRAAELTHILRLDVHPTDLGHRVIVSAFAPPARIHPTVVAAKPSVRRP